MDLCEVSSTLDKFWLHHERRLDQCLQLRKFEEKFKHVGYSAFYLILVEFHAR